MSKEFTDQLAKEKAIAKSGKPLDADMAEEQDEEDEGEEETKGLEEFKQSEKSKFGGNAQMDEVSEEDENEAADGIADLGQASEALEAMHLGIREGLKPPGGFGSMPIKAT